MTADQKEQLHYWLTNNMRVDQTTAYQITKHVENYFPPASLSPQGQMKWVRASEPPEVNDLYHTRIRMKDTDLDTFPAATNFIGGEWEISEDYEVVYWLDELAALDSLPGEGGDRWVRVEDGLPERIKGKKTIVQGWDGKCQYILQYVFPKQESIDTEDFKDDFNWDESDYDSDEKAGETYLKEGFWEEVENQGYHDFIWYKRTITHWRPLPSTPVQNENK